MYARKKNEDASANSRAVSPVSRRIVGESTAQTCRSTKASHEHSAIPRHGTQTRQSIVTRPAVSGLWARASVGNEGMFRILRQGKCHKRVRSHDGDVLFAAPALIRNGIGVPDPLEPCHPQLFTRLRLEGAETAVVGATDEDQATSRHRGTRAPTVAGIPLALRQRLCQ